MHDLTYKGHVNLQNCEDEPIHLLGKLQTHGLLLGFDNHFHLTHFSDNARSFFEDKQPLQGQFPLADLLGEKAQQEALEFWSSNLPSQLHIDNLHRIAGQLYRIYWYRSQESSLMAELEVIDETSHSTLIPALSDFYSFQHHISSETSELDIAVYVVNSFRKITGFDRVMFYKFDYNGDGEVIAEDRKRGLESFLGLRYPASDIPEQARKLYVVNKVRSIKDISDEGVPIYSLRSEQPIDLTHSIYRSVSPIHLQYLKNMGVAATHANSILKGKELWGMIICHHYDGPKKLSFTGRMLTTFYANAVNNWLLNTELGHQTRRKQKQHQLIQTIMRDRSSKSIDDLLKKLTPSLQELLSIAGFSYLTDDQQSHHGLHLEKTDELMSLVEELKKNTLEGKPQIFYDNNVRFTNPSANGIGGVAGFYSGLIKDEFVFFFRPEKRDIYRWAGKPQKREDDQSPLTPRNSFNVWQETVKGKSEPWSDDDRQFIEELVKALDFFETSNAPDSKTESSATLRVRSLHQRIRSLEEAKAELLRQMRDMQETVEESLQIQELRNVVLSNMSHEMRTPLHGIIGLADLIKESDESTPGLKEYSDLIAESGYRMLTTFNRLMSLDLAGHQKLEKSKKTVQLETFIDDLLMPLQRLTKNSSKQLQWRVHNQRQNLVMDDRLLGQVIINLVNNALKYGGADVFVQVDIRVLWQGDQKLLVLTVEDDGPGIPEEIQDKIFEPFYMGEEVTKQSDNSGGLGLYIVKSYVEFLNGTIELESGVAQGASFTVSIPLTTQE